MKITEKQFLEAELNEFNLTMKNKGFVGLAESVFRYVRNFHPKLVIDYGCGTGVYSEVLRRNGLNVIAQDVFKVHRDYCKDNYPDLKVIAKPKKAEFMLFIEVAEHMTYQEIKEAIEVIQPDKILFSSTPNITEQDEDWGHINIKNEYEWGAFWNELGYIVTDKPKTPTLWALMLEKI